MNHLKVAKVEVAAAPIVAVSVKVHVRQRVQGLVRQLACLMQQIQQDVIMAAKENASLVVQTFAYIQVNDK